jgi:hypothetical protein
VAITITPSPVNPRPYEPVTLTVAGGANNTPYVISAARPSGAVTNIEVTTDGSGAATAKFVPQSAPGAVTFSIRPATEYTGTTTAAATNNALKTHG